MCKIRLIGLPNEKYEGLKKRIESLIELSDEDIELVEVKNVHLIVEEKIGVVPSAVYEGKKRYQWNQHTSLEVMMAEMKEDRKNRSNPCKGEGDCRMRNLDPSC